MLKICKKLQEKRFVFVKILAIIIPENGAKVSKIKCLRLNQQTLVRPEMCSDIAGRCDQLQAESILLVFLNPALLPDKQ